jgi:hypothetical protein
VEKVTGKHRATICGFVGINFFPAMVLAGPAIVTTWNNNQLSQMECMKRAEEVVQGMAPTLRISNINETVFGEADDYTVFVRCISSKELVLFWLG